MNRVWDEGRMGRETTTGQGDLEKWGQGEKNI